MQVSTFKESILIPISILSGAPEIIDLTHGIERLLPGYYYVLRTDIHVGPEADVLVAEPDRWAYIG